MRPREKGRGRLYKFVAESEDEDYDASKPMRYVHVVSTNVFDNMQAFRFRTDALTYAFDWVRQMSDATPALSYSLYREAYVAVGMVIMRPVNEKSDIAVTIRKTEIRRNKCSVKIRG